jgi:glutamine synthetase
MHSAALITTLVQRIRTDFRMQPVTASEIEFYLPGSDACATLPEFWENIKTACANAGIALYNYSKETGKEQHEIALAPVPDPLKTARDTIALKDIIATAAIAHNMRADFAAKPFADQPGSGLHIHIHLQDATGKNAYYKNDDAISAGLKYSLGGLLNWLPDCMPAFAPSEASYQRFTPKSNAPLTISWGANNRTVALRLPDSEHENKRIEHRVSGADANPQLVMAAILAAIHYGIVTTSEPGEQTYGDASLPMYNLPKFPTSLDEAKQRLNHSKLLAGYFSAQDLLPTH